MKIQFLGATQTVTGSKYLLTLGERKILVDCGLFQGLKELRLRNWANFPIDPKTIDAVVLTHAHIDHSGYLPLLAKNGFQKKIYCTNATKDLCGIMLPDSGFLQEEEARRANKYGYSKHRPALPLYTMEDAKNVLPQIEELDFAEEHKISDEISLHFNVAGHILGAATIIIRYREKTILFSGDLGRDNDPIMRAPQKREATDYLVVEATYGNRLHDLSDPMEQLGDVINRTTKRGGTLIIPAFAVGRTQLILYYIYKLKKAKKISDIPVFLDSPLATDATDIFKQYHSEHRLSAEESAAVCKTAHYVNTVDESKLIDTYAMPKIIISASGMAVGGRVLHHLRVFAKDSKNTVLFCGFQATGTRGDKMLRGINEIKLLGEVVAINAEIVSLSNISAHADSDEVLAWLVSSSQKPKKTFVTHGELRAALALKQKIEEKLHWDRCLVPKYLEVEEL